MKRMSRFVNRMGKGFFGTFWSNSIHIEEYVPKKLYQGTFVHPQTNQNTLY